MSVSPIIKRYRRLIESVESRIDYIDRQRSYLFGLSSNPGNYSALRHLSNTRRRRLCHEEGVLRDELAALHVGLSKFIKELNEAREC